MNQLQQNIAPFAQRINGAIPKSDRLPFLTTLGVLIFVGLFLAIIVTVWLAFRKEKVLRKIQQLERVEETAIQAWYGNEDWYQNTLGELEKQGKEKKTEPKKNCK